MNSISKTKQSNFPRHFFKTLNWIYFKRWLLPCASTKCRPIAKYLCSIKTRGAKLPLPLKYNDNFGNILTVTIKSSDIPRWLPIQYVP